MKITVTWGDKIHTAHLPYDGADHVIVDDVPRCPSCQKLAPMVCGVQSAIKVAGKNKHIESHDTYASDAVALCCREQIGTLRVKMETVFGIEEDERVLNGPWKVY